MPLERQNEAMAAITAMSFQASMGRTSKPGAHVVAFVKGTIVLQNDRELNRRFLTTTSLLTMSCRPVFGSRSFIRVILKSGRDAGM